MLGSELTVAIFRLIIRLLDVVDALFDLAIQSLTVSLLLHHNETVLAMVRIPLVILDALSS
jgi:hypothetical protein